VSATSSLSVFLRDFSQRIKILNTFTLSLHNISLTTLHLKKVTNFSHFPFSTHVAVVVVVVSFSFHFLWHVPNFFTTQKTPLNIHIIHHKREKKYDVNNNYNIYPNNIGKKHKQKLMMLTITITYQVSKSSCKS
jgi:hypothetical protein